MAADAETIRVATLPASHRVDVAAGPEVLAELVLVSVVVLLVVVVTRAVEELTPDAV